MPNPVWQKHCNCDRGRSKRDADFFGGKHSWMEDCPIDAHADKRLYILGWHGSQQIVTLTTSNYDYS